MKIGVLVFLTAQSGDPGAIAREAENLGYESFFVAEHLVVPTTYAAPEESTTIPLPASGPLPPR